MRLRSRLTVVATGTALVATAGVAFAAWTVDGTGTGAATTGTAKDLTVVASSIDADLYPGGPAGAVGFEVTNPNPFDVRLTSVSYGALGTGGSACAAANVTMAPGAPTAVSIVVPAGQTVADSIPGVLRLAAAADDSCQGVPLTVGLSFSGAQQ
ncbi:MULTISPECIES: hypothetical protein [unclassified Nocardioides]|uniref:hypothetical protein n=1 Tax=unclassified Nocardioides TaxID=2615069 RepID=UPI00361F7416